MLYHVRVSSSLFWRVRDRVSAESVLVQHPIHVCIERFKGSVSHSLYEGEVDSVCEREVGGITTRSTYELAEVRERKVTVSLLIVYSAVAES